MSGLFESLGAGTGGGFVGTLLGYFVGSKQVENVHKRIDRLQTEVDGKVASPTFEATIEAIKEQHKSMDKKLDIIIEHSTRKREDNR